MFYSKPFLDPNQQLARFSIVGGSICAAGGTYEINCSSGLDERMGPEFALMVLSGINEIWKKKIPDYLKYLALFPLIGVVVCFALAFTGESNGPDTTLMGIGIFALFLVFCPSMYRQHLMLQAGKDIAQYCNELSNEHRKAGIYFVAERRLEVTSRGNARSPFTDIYACATPATAMPAQVSIAMNPIPIMAPAPPVAMPVAVGIAAPIMNKSAVAPPMDGLPSNHVKVVVNDNNE